MGGNSEEPAMTPRKRLLLTMANGAADRVPVTPDISCMVPVRLSGKGYFNVLVHNDPPLWRAYIDAVKHYGIDGWFTYGHVAFTTRDITADDRWLPATDGRKVRQITYHTPDGDLTERILYSPDNPPVRVKKMIEDPRRDLPRYRHLIGPIAATDTSLLRRQRAELGELGILGVSVPTPGFHVWTEFFEGGIQTLSYLEADAPALLEDLAEVYHARLMEELRHALRAGFDFVLTGGSGSITLASPTLWLKYAFPTLKAICRECSRAGVPTMVHSCGRQRFMVETCARETDLNCINPLEIPPMGDMTLREAKRTVSGSRVTLMGNLHTTDVMLFGTPERVREASRQAIEDAGRGGGFILSTGDQCGWNTPDANIFAMVEAVEAYGHYDTLERSPGHG